MGCLELCNASYVQGFTSALKTVKIVIVSNFPDS